VPHDPFIRFSLGLALYRLNISASFNRHVGTSHHFVKGWIAKAAASLDQWP
jgi:hypothetical protein